MNGNWPDAPLRLTDADIDEHIKKYDTIVVDCWAPWCSPCRTIEPIIQELAKEMQGKIAFGKLDVDKNKLIILKYQITRIPTLLVFKNGKLDYKLIGFMSKNILKQKLET